MWIEEILRIFIALILCLAVINSSDDGRNSQAFDVKLKEQFFSTCKTTSQKKHRQIKKKEAFVLHNHQLSLRKRYKLPVQQGL